MKNRLEETNLDIKNILTPDYAARFAYLSFRHSQGNQWLQRQIVSFVHIIRPSWDVNESDVPAISIELNKLLQSYDIMREKGLHVSNTVATSPHGTDQAVSRIVYLMENFLKRDDEPESIIIKEITTGIIGQDHLFLTRENGRDKTSPDIKVPLRDNFLSHVIHFGLNANPTGLTEFDEMYRDVRAHILLGQLDQESQDKFDKVMEIYKTKHPEVAIKMQP